MSKNEGFKLIFDEKPKAYGSVECATEEGYNFLIRATKVARDAKLTDEETKSAAETFKVMFTNAAVAYKLDSRKKSIRYSCSACGSVFYMYPKYIYQYCPYCAARFIDVEEE